MEDEAADALANLQRERRSAAPPAPPVPHLSPPAPAPAAMRFTPGMILLGLLSLLLMAVGIWALAAVLYMWRVTPTVAQNDVSFPLLHWDWLHYQYTASSRLLAGAMLLCWPVAALLLAALFLMRRTARRRITPAYRR